jgi:hypothetical protein
MSEMVRKFFGEVSLSRGSRAARQISQVMLCKCVADLMTFRRRSARKYPVSADSVLVQDSEPVSATIQGGVVLLSVRAGAYFKLNRVGAEIWNMLTEPRRAGEIIDVLAQNYGADNGTVSRDVTPFLAMLIQHQLLLVIDPDVIR